MKSTLIATCFFFLLSLTGITQSHDNIHFEGNSAAQKIQLTYESFDHNFWYHEDGSLCETEKIASLNATEGLPSDTCTVAVHLNYVAAKDQINFDDFFSETLSCPSLFDMLYPRHEFFCTCKYRDNVTVYSDTTIIQTDINNKWYNADGTPVQLEKNGILYDFESFSLDMFSAEELLNDTTTVYYWNYIHTTPKKLSFDDFFTKPDTLR
jgi:hypothetical protein